MSTLLYSMVMLIANVRLAALNRCTRIFRQEENGLIIAYLNDVLIDEVCRRDYQKYFYLNLCERYKNNTLTDNDLERMFGDFVAVNVYFEDLNYEIMKEEPLYNTVRFLSDIGGAMGLFTGASALTYFEILQVIVEIGIFFRNRRRSTVNNIN